VRALENKKIAEFYEGQVIDLVKIEEEAQKYHSRKMEDKDKLYCAEGFKKEHLQDDKKERHETYLGDIKDFKENLMENFKEKILKQVLDKCEKAKEEREARQTQRRMKNLEKRKRKLESKLAKQKAQE